MPIGRWVLREACRQASVWERASPGFPSVMINVNISGAQLHHASLVADVRAALEAAELPAAHLTLEITESVMMRDTEATTARLDALIALGVKLAIDDFGTGYSSLSYLRRFPVSMLKVPKNFVDDITTNPEIAALANGIVTLARTLNLVVVAEGIEAAGQAAELGRMECELGQGYYFAQPVDEDALGQLLGDQHHSGGPIRSVVV